MPVPQQRDPDLTRRRLTAWLADNVPEATDVELNVRLPDGRGFSNETLLLDAEWTQRGARHRQPLVARVAATGYRVMPGSRLGEEYRVLEALSGTNVPVPAVYGYEPDPEILGAPFCVMARVDGWVPPDLPSYHREGPVAALAADDRERLWWAGVEMLHRIHRLDTEVLGLGFLHQSPDGPAGLRGQLAFYEAHLDFFGCADSPVVRGAMEWLGQCLPPEPATVGLAWGDARLGNIIFDGVTPAAILDWEMVFLGPGEADLAWYLYLDRHLSEGIGAQRLPGLPDRARTVARYEELVGRAIGQHLDWYEVFAGFRFALITSRVGRLLVEHGIVATEADVPLARNAARLLARTLEPMG